VLRDRVVNEFLEQFLIEGRELVEQATEDLLALEEAPDERAELDSAFRDFHTLKGLAGIVEFAAMSRVLHAAEDSLAAVRSGKRPVTGELVTDLLFCIDQVAQWLDELEREDRLPTVTDAAANALVARFQDPAPHTPVLTDAVGTEEPDWVAALLSDHPSEREQSGVAVRYRPEPGCFFCGIDPVALIAQLPDLRAISLIPNDPWPPLEELDPFACNLTITALTGGAPDQVADQLHDAAGQVEIRALGPARPERALGALSPEATRLLEEQLLLVSNSVDEGFSGRVVSAGRVSVNVLRLAGWASEAEQVRQVSDESLRLGEAETLADLLRHLLGRPSEAPAPDERDKRSFARPDEIAVRALRVEVERIDALVRLAGELTVAKNAVGYAARLAKEGAEATTLAALLSDQHALLDRCVEELHRSLLGIRVLPLRHLFRRFPKLVREMAIDLGKSARLVTEGDATEADKAVVEALSEPLLHVLRNAVDHGIEPAAQRAAAGKSAVATVWLRAAREGEQVVVEVEDDGTGIDIVKVRRIAEARGLAGSDALAAMTDSEITELIFAPGLSTAASVSTVSGRGVGMDAVRSAIARLGGQVEIETRPGAGTRVRFRIPFTVLMSRVLTLEVGGQMFGIPMEIVVETLRLPRDRIMRVGAAEAFVLRHRTIPLINLPDALGLRRDPLDDCHAHVVITSGAGEVVALEVDHFGDHVEVMLRPVEGLLTGFPGIAGTTLLGDGRVLIVLDVPELLG
jgi:two-component system, chemotaxis family, sensor kinase CheA